MHQSRFRSEQYFNLDTNRRRRVDAKCSDEKIDSKDETKQHLARIAVLEKKLRAAESQNVLLKEVCDKLSARENLTCAEVMLKEKTSEINKLKKKTTK